MVRRLTLCVVPGIFGRDLDLRDPMSVRGRRWAWWATFLGLFLLSLDYWRWDQAPQLGMLGLPTWTRYFVLLQVVLSATIAAFARSDWEGDPAPSPDAPDRP